MGLIEGFSISAVLLIASVYGLPGLVLVFWYVDHRKMDRMRAEDKEHLNTVLKAYEDDMHKMSRFYHSNVKLVENYEKLADDLSEIIHLNTQVQTQLVEQIKNNMFCPMVREKGPQR